MSQIHLFRVKHHNQNLEFKKMILSNCLKIPFHPLKEKTLEKSEDQKEESRKDLAKSRVKILKALINQFHKLKILELNDKSLRLKVTKLMNRMTNRIV